MRIREGHPVLDTADCLDLSRLKDGGLCRGPDGRLWTLVRVWRPVHDGHQLAAFVEFCAVDGKEPKFISGSFFASIFRDFQIITPAYSDNLNFGDFPKPKPIPEWAKKRRARISLNAANSNSTGWIARLMNWLRP